jgi:hypothetical protein
MLVVARDLEVIDQNFPDVGDAYVNTAMEYGYAFLSADGVAAFLDHAGHHGESRQVHWRYGFSDRLLMADAFDTLLSAMRRWRDGSRRSWTEEHIVKVKIMGDLEDGPNPLVRLIFRTLDLSTWSRENKVRGCRAHLRLLRIAARWKANGELQELEDPFGQKLLSSNAGGTLKVWSVGQDGVDDGGVGEWSPKKGKDVVLEARR